MESLSRVIISSLSPPPQFPAHNMSSSPLPSPSELFRKKSATPGARGSAVPISSTALASFTTASTLQMATKVKMKELVTADTHDDVGLDIRNSTKASKPKVKNSIAKRSDGEPKPAKAIRKTKPTATAAPATDDPNTAARAKKQRKPRVTKSEHFAEGGVVKHEVPPKKPRAKKVDNDLAGGPKQKAVRKPRVKKVVDTSQTLFPEGQVTKPASGSRKTKVKPTNLDDSLDFGLVEAVRRRSTWTPPPAATTEEVTDTPASALIEDLVSSSVGTSSKRSKGFNNLLGTFGFTSSGSTTGEPSDTTSKAQDQAIIRKRKLIELFKANNSDGSISPTKKAPKKKPRTITECATAAYAVQEISNIDPTPLLQYFSLENKETSPIIAFKIPSKPRSRSPKKGAKEAPILLSPESAMKQVSNQDFVFGTSSQLAREDSPTLLRDLHQAMQASLNHTDPSDYLHDPFSTPAKPTRNLWNAASRAANGELLDVETIQATESTIVAADMVRSCDDIDDWLDIDELTKDKKDVELLPLEMSSSKTPRSGSPTSRARKSLSPKSSQATKPSSFQITRAAASTDLPQIPPMPVYASYTTAQLAKAIASYGFKAVKSREGMITLLERCWEGKHRTALQSLDSNIPKTSPAKISKASASSQISPKRPRGRPKKVDLVAISPAAKIKVGRPRKDSSVAAPSITKAKSGQSNITATDSGSTLDKISTPKKGKKSRQLAEEISDSDCPLTPSPPRRRLSQVGQPPSPLQLRASEIDSSPERTSSQAQALLFEHITKAVKGTSPSTDSKSPTWHEKILLYDPIVLEDLAAWLNTSALGTVGWDGEVAPAEVKKWCESKSICCLWKENLRGGSRSRY